MPAPFLVSVPVVVTMAPEMTVSPAPWTVSGRVLPAKPPESVRVPASLSTVVPPAPRVSSPDQVLLLARLRIAPVPPMPVPMMLVMGSPMESPEPSISMAAPVATVVAPEVAPRAALDWTRMSPADSVVTPV